MPEEAELHSIRRGCRGNRRLLPERLVSYKVPARLAFRAAAQLPRSPAAAPRLSGQVSASQRIRWHPAPQLGWRGDDFRNAHDKGLHDVGMLQQDLLDLGATLTPPILIISFSRPRSHLPPPASQRNSIIVSSRQGRARRGSRVKKDCAIFSSCCTPYCVKKTVGHKILTEITRASHQRGGQRQASGVTDERGVLIEPQLREGPLGDRKRRVTRRLCRNLPLHSDCLAGHRLR